MNPIPVQIPEKIAAAFWNFDGTPRESTYKILRGGRGSGKSETIARLLIAEARTMKQRILCTRMYQNSVADSVHATLVGAAEEMGVLHEFEVLDKAIRHRKTGSDFIFKGLKRDIGSIKSMKGVRRCWVEEAENVPLDTWRTLEPTFRIEGSEIWVSYNPENELSATHRMALSGVGDGSGINPSIISVDCNWRDNPFFPKNMEEKRLRALALDQDAYDWIWEGKTRKITNAVIFRDRVVFDIPFEDPIGVRPFFGLDFGESNDPTAGVRMFIEPYDDGEALYISHEAFGWQVPLDETHKLLTGELIKGQELPDVQDWPMKCDASRPGMIAFMEKKSFNASAAKKWAGSVEDGIGHLKSFKRIFVHPRCENVGQEFRLYSYKTDPKMIDPKTEQPMVLPIILDRHNHGIDAIRYALDGRIEQGGSGLGVWAKLAG